MSTIKILEQLVKEFPLKDLKLSQVFALHNAKACIDKHREKLQSKHKPRLTDRGS